MGSRLKRILVVDDHPVVREGIARLLEEEDGELSLCGTASDAVSARQAAVALAPDLAIVDLALGRDSGLELISQLVDEVPGLAILALSMHDEALYAGRALQAGARGYVM